MSEDTCSVKVVVRFRPINEREKREGESRNYAVKIHDDCRVEIPDNPTFTFDRAFAPGSAQGNVYEYTAKQTIDDVLNGYNGTIFAFGQTGSGKTFTMFGPDNIESDEDKGIVPRASAHLFSSIRNDPREIQYSIKASFLEIYKENIRDLLNPTSNALPVRESPTRGVYVEHLTEEYVSSEDDITELIHQGEASRSVSATQMNERSSRSHSLFIITVEQKNLVDDSIKVGKLNLIDLAGSEKVGKTGATGNTLEEAKKINQSLSALGNCIHALTEAKRGHIPYRDSKLTRILQESLGGNTKTTLVITASPHVFNAEETLGSLRFGARAKTIKNKVSQNVTLSVEELMTIIKGLKDELVRLKSYCVSLEAHINGIKSGDIDPAEDLPKMPRGVPVPQAEPEKVAVSAPSLPQVSNGSTTVSLVSASTPVLPAPTKIASSTPTPAATPTTKVKSTPTKAAAAPTKSTPTKATTTATTTATTPAATGTRTPIKRSTSGMVARTTPTTQKATTAAAASSTKRTPVSKATASTRAATPTKTTTTTTKVTTKVTATKTTATKTTSATPTKATPARATATSSTPAIKRTTSQTTLAPTTPKKAPSKSIAPVEEYDPLADIQKQIQAARAQEQFSYQVEQKQDQIEELEDKLEAKADEITQLCEQLEKLQKELLDSQKGNKRAQLESSSTKEELLVLEAHFQEKIQDLENVYSQSQSRQTELETLMEEKAQLAAQFKQLYEDSLAESQPLKLANSSLSDQIQTLEAKLTLSSEQLRKAQEEWQEKEKQQIDPESVKRLEQEIEIRTEQTEQLESSLKSLRAQLSEEQTRSQASAKYIEHLQSELQWSPEQISESQSSNQWTPPPEQIALQSLLDETLHERDSLQRALQLSQSSQSSHESQNSQLQQKLHDLVGKSELLHADKALLVLEAQKWEERFLKLEEELREKDALLQRAKTSAMENDLALATSQKLLDEAKSRPALQNAGADGFANAQASGKLASLLDEQKKKLIDLQMGLDDALSDISAVKLSRDNYADENSRLRKELDRATRMLADSESRRSRVFRPISYTGPLGARAKPMQEVIDFSMVRAALRRTGVLDS